MSNLTPEFDLIQRYFSRSGGKATLGIGDDCALVQVAPGNELAISTDTLVSGTHFFADTNPQKLGHKSLAVNLSDLAAMGADPRWFTLALTLPEINHDWLAAFARGLFSLADEHHIELIGGDTTRGSLSITITVMGEVPKSQALRRDWAIAGDDVWVSGELGDAALALAQIQGRVLLPANIYQKIEQRLLLPTPRIELGKMLRGIAHAAIDISDGLIADLGHICERSKLSATLQWDALPMSSAMKAIPIKLQQALILAGGDDYELCFTAPVSAREKLQQFSPAVFRIGTMNDGASDVNVLNAKNEKIEIERVGYDHFAE